jgi:hypothetical protein
MGYTKRQMAAVIEHVGRQLEYRTAPSTKTAAALLAARAKLVKTCGGSGAGSLVDSVRIRREHMLRSRRTRKQHGRAD